MVPSRTETKLADAFAMYFPVVATVFVLLWAYLCYKRGLHRPSSSPLARTARLGSDDIFSTCRFGLRKDVRDMLPVTVFKESFYVKDTECSVCLGEYQAEDKLKQIPSCGHTFHMHCIDQWLSTQSTCPLCRIIPLVSRVPNQLTPEIEAGETSQSRERDIHSGGPQHGEPQQGQQVSSPADLDENHWDISVHVDCG